MSSTGTMPPFTGNIDFNAQHSPFGAYMSFTCGHLNAGGGIGVELGKPASQNLFIGVKSGDRKSRNPLRCLPFIKTAGGATAASNFEVGQQSQGIDTAPPVPASKSMQPYGIKELSRHFGWATDTWVAPDFSFSVFTPFGPVPEPSLDAEAMRASLLPAVIATLTVDNRAGTETKTAVFAVDFVQPGARLLQGFDAPAGTPPKLGFAWRRSLGVLGMVEDAGDDPDALFAFQRWSVAEGLADINPIHELGTCGGLALEVAPGISRTLVLAIGCHQDGIVSTGLEGRYFYTRCYTNLEDVLTAALERAGELRSQAARLDARLAGSGLSADQQFLIAHGTRSYYGNTQLLEVGGEPFFIVNEGEYCMMNTLDLSIDHAFWELEHHPWAVRNILGNFVRHYSYQDQLKGRGTQLLPGGIAFCHDMGANNNFSRPGYSSYELPNLNGCFSYMAQEELCNWILLAACYFAKTADSDWLRQNSPTIRASLESMIARGGNAGFSQFDTARCGQGQEITTYDSLDHSLAQTRNNVYIATKSWACYLGLALMLAALDDDSAADLARRGAEKVAGAITAQAAGDVIPAVFERNNPGFQSRILPAIEGYLYPLYWDQNDLSTRKLPDLAQDAPHKAMFDALNRHTRALLLDAQRRNLFDDGGIRLSSTSNNSWMSKIAIFQHVAREVFRTGDDPAIAKIFTEADAAHVKWQTDGSSYWACSDQIVSGEAKGSRYYPRIVVAALWLGHAPSPRAPKRRAPSTTAKA